MTAAGTTPETISDGSFQIIPCCEWKVFPVACDELTVLRRFRVNFLQNTSGGRFLAEEFHRIASDLVARPNCDHVDFLIWERSFCMIVTQHFPEEQPLRTLAESVLESPTGQPAHRVKVIVLLPQRQDAFRRIVEQWSDNFIWLTQEQLRQGNLCRQLLRWEKEGFPPPDGVFVSMPQPLLPEDADDLCPAIEYYFRFALFPSLFCVLTTSPDLAKFLTQSWAQYT